MSQNYATHLVMAKGTAKFSTKPLFYYANLGNSVRKHLPFSCVFKCFAIILQQFFRYNDI